MTSLAFFLLIMLQATLLKTLTICGICNSAIMEESRTQTYTLSYDRKFYYKIQACNHESKFHNNCIERYISSATAVVHDEEETAIPSPTCNHSISVLSYGKVLDRQLKEISW
ncbi:hypothetical protein ROZALSC1DRAFT_22140, partial [Rozella allomycis CSF55]